MTREVAVRISADVAEAVQNVDRFTQSTEQAADAADRLGEASRQASQSTQQAGQQSQAAASQTDELGRSSEQASASVASMGEGLSGARAAGAEFLETAAGMRSEFTQVGVSLGVVGGGLTALMGSLVQTGIQYNTLQQVAGRAMETMAGSAEAAASQMERLHAFADESPFARQTWITAQQQLMAFGMEAERVVPTLEGIQNAVAAIGGGDQEIMQLVDILGSVEGQGRITGRELQRLGQMAINAADLIGEAMGVSGNEIREQITAGALDAETAITALTQGMNTAFEGAAEGLRDTLPGAIDRIQARIRDLGGVLASPLVSPDGGGFLVEAINMAADFGSALLNLPDPLLQVAGGIAGLTGGALLLGSAFFIAAPRVMGFYNSVTNTVGAIRDFSAAHPGMTGGLRGIGAAATVAAAGIAAIAALDWAWDRFAPAARDIKEVEVSLRQLARTGEDTGAIEDYGVALDHLDSTGGKLRNNIPGWAAALLTGFNPAAGMSVAATQQLSEEFENIDATLASFVQGGSFDLAATGFERIAQDMQAAGHSAEDIIDIFPGLSGEIANLAAESGHTASAADILAVATNGAALAALGAGEPWSVVSRLVSQGADAFYEAEGAMSSAIDASNGMRDVYSRLAEAVGEASASVSSLVEDMNAYAGIALEAEAVSDAWIESLQEIDSALNDSEIENTLDAATEAGRGNREMLRGMATDALEAAAAEATLGGSLEDTQGIIDQSIDYLTKFGEAAGMSADEIDEMIRRYMGFNDVEPIEIQAENRAKEIFDEVEEQIHNLPDDWEMWLSAQDQDVQDVLNGLLDRDLELVAEILADPALAEAVMTAFENGDYKAIADIMADAANAEAVVYDFQTGQYEAVVDINGNDVPAHQVLAALMNGNYEAVTDIVGNDQDALRVIRAFENGDYSAIARIMGDDAAARGTMNGFTGTGWRTSVSVLADTTAARLAIQALNGSQIRVNVSASSIGALAGSAARGATGGLFSNGRFSRYQHGGLARYAGGGLSGTRLPRTGAGTDRILAYSPHTGLPVALLDDEEYITKKTSTRKHLGLLEAINRDDLLGMRQYLERLPAYQQGGYQGRVREFSAPRVAGSPGIDYNRLAQAVGQQKHVHFNFENHYPRGETASAAAQRVVDMVGGGLDPDDWAGGD